MALPGVLAIETAGLAAWPGLEVERDGGWIRRAANGYTKRSNSVQSLDPADDRDAGARLEAAARWFRLRNLPPVFRVTPLAGPAVIAALDAAGWHKADHSRVMAMDLGPVAADARGKIVPAASTAFLAAQQRLQGYDQTDRERLAAVIGAIGGPAAGVIVRNDAGEPVAAALMAVADGIAVTGNVVTAAAERRKGLAAAVMRTGLAWAREAGATVAALNVVADNMAANALYDGLGYRHQYDYHYRTAPQ